MLGLCEELGLRSLQPVDAGLRLGVLWDLQLRARQQDRRDDSIARFSARFGVDELRASQVTANSAALFEQMKPDSDQLQRLLGWSAQLHEIGLVVSRTGFHKHGAYLSEHADLPGFSAHEQKILSTLVVAQKGNLHKISQALADPDFAKAIAALRLGIIFMQARLDPALDYVRLNLKGHIDLELTKKTLADHPTLSYWLAREQGVWEDIGVEFNIKMID